MQKFGPELSKRTEKHLYHASLDWHVDETYRLVGGKWRYLWHAIDANEPFLDFRLTARCYAKAARAFLKQAIERERLHRPVSICTDKAPTYKKVIREINRRYGPHFNYITHIDRKHLNNRKEGDHAFLKILLGYQQSFRSLQSARVTLQGMEKLRTIKNGHIQIRQPGVSGEIAFVHKRFGSAS